jgi:hypothetical protein
LRWRAVTTLLARLAIECAASARSALANIPRNFIAERHWLKRAIVVQRFTPVARWSATVRGRMITNMLAKLGDSTWVGAARTCAGAYWLLNYIFGMQPASGSMSAISICHYLLLWL